MGPSFFEGVDGNYMQLIDEPEELLMLNEYCIGSPRIYAPNIAGEKSEQLKPRATSILNLVGRNEVYSSRCSYLEGRWRKH